MALTAAERKRRQRERAKAAGLCARCCLHPPEPGRTHCTDCIESGTERREHSRS